MKILIISDSFGTDYGCKSYTSYLREAGHDIYLIPFPGNSINKIYKYLATYRSTVKFDQIIIQVGAPDFFPRMPKKLLDGKARRIKLRDSMFVLPPEYSIKFLFKFPLFLLRIFLIRIFPEKFTEIGVFLKEFNRIYILLKDMGVPIKVIPVFSGNRYIYMKNYFRTIQLVNLKLKQRYTCSYLDNEVLSYNFYSQYFLPDFFHLNCNYHKILSQIIDSSN